jgi:hypothetical protein
MTEASDHHGGTGSRRILNAGSAEIAETNNQPRVCRATRGMGRAGLQTQATGGDLGGL